MSYPYLNTFTFLVIVTILTIFFSSKVGLNCMHLILVEITVERSVFACSKSFGDKFMTSSFYDDSDHIGLL